MAAPVSDRKLHHFQGKVPNPKRRKPSKSYKPPRNTRRIDQFFAGDTLSPQEAKVDNQVYLTLPAALPEEVPARVRKYHRLSQIIFHEGVESLAELFCDFIVDHINHPKVSPHFFVSALSILGHIRKDESLIQRAIDLMPDSPVGYSYQGLYFLQCNEPHKAADSFRRSLEKGAIWEAHSGLGDIYLARNEAHKALESYSAALALFKIESPERHFELTMKKAKTAILANLVLEGVKIYLTLQRETRLNKDLPFEKRVKRLEVIRAALENCSGGLLKATKEYVKEQQWASAEFTVNTLIQIQPHCWEAYLLSAKCLEVRRNIDLAKNHFGAVFTNANRENLTQEVYLSLIHEYFSLGLTLFKPSFSPFTLEELQATFRMHPTNLPLTHFLGDFLRWRNRYEAFLHYTEALRYHPDDPDLLLHRDDLIDTLEIVPATPPHEGEDTLPNPISPMNDDFFVPATP